ncbi:5,10-methylenetetrahydrofolate reductase [Salinisphaera sp. USBA-960]|uniref:methylenetetrahydrofolate reductase n=1 Tax=Salinisphaera orenii TaxID=856731 RepID=UPI000DBE156C|nr:5,10-methylenetetrahydrofolate reductase [Salifodinibacter halophilus]NNC26900.1 5,10-methylenetetrahydrofolate reductase [Salifodinibacter halophilus]
MSDRTRTTMGRALASPDFEIMPIKGGLEAARHMPAGAFTAVTCSPAQGVDGTVEFAASIQAMGLTAAVHLAARRITDHAHLERLLSRMREAGIRHAFVVAGDRTDTPGAFTSGLELVQTLRQTGAELDSIGVPCYPEGHSFIDDATLADALQAKAKYADYMVSQLCFNPQAILDWLTYTREHNNVNLPLYIGAPGVMARTKLLNIGLRIGIGDSIRFLRKNSGFISGFLTGSKYKPDHLINELATKIDDPALNIAGLHINTFNQIEATEDWRNDQLGKWQTADKATTATEPG